MQYDIYCYNIETFYDAAIRSKDDPLWMLNRTVSVFVSQKSIITLKTPSTKATPIFRPDRKDILDMIANKIEIILLCRKKTNCACIAAVINLSSSCYQSRIPQQL